MRTVTAPGEHSVLVERIVELRVVREKDGRTGSAGSCGHVLLRVDVRLEILDTRVRRIVHEIESGTARAKKKGISPQRKRGYKEKGDKSNFYILCLRGRPRARSVDSNPKCAKWGQRTFS